MERKQIDLGPRHCEVRVGSVALNRLIAEVSAGAEISTARGYNRTHNRHNR